MPSLHRCFSPYRRLAGDPWRLLSRRSVACAIIAAPTVMRTVDVSIVDSNNGQAAPESCDAIDDPSLVSRRNQLRPVNMAD
jgi:hypothetical protein